MTFQGLRVSRIDNGIMEQYLKDFINLIYPEGDQPRTAAEWKEAYIGIFILAVFVSFGLYMLSQS